MMRQLLLWLSAILFIFNINTVFATDIYKLDPNHSYVQWHISHFGFSNPSGKWFVNGTLILDKINPSNSKVNVTIQMASIDTGIKELDKHLSGQDFFDVTKYPTATFTSNKILITGKNTAIIQGPLTLHGITKTVTLRVRLNKAGINPITNLATAGFTATTTLDRSDFGINTFLPSLSNQVKIDIEVEANKPTT